MPRLRSVLPNIVVFSALLVGGCLPSSCQRQESHAITAADSLSRNIAAGIAIDTLTVAWSTNAETTPLTYPRTIRAGTDGLFYVGDSEADAVVVFDDTGQVRHLLSSSRFDIPYVAGFRKDTLFVFSAGSDSMSAVVAGKVQSRFRIDIDEGFSTGLRYITTFGRGFFLKALTEERDGYIAELDWQGRERSRIALPGPQWLHAGMMRMWSDSLLSLRGYLPVIDVVADGQLDTLALVGFDSPMLARTRAYQTGSASAPALLTASAAPSEASLFVLNMRPGWLRIDVYDKHGRLVRALIEPEPSFGRDFYPTDLDVRRNRTGEFDIGVAFVEPVPGVTVFRWRG